MFCFVFPQERHKAFWSWASLLLKPMEAPSAIGPFWVLQLYAFCPYAGTFSPRWVAPGVSPLAVTPQLTPCHAVPFFSLLFAGLVTVSPGFTQGEQSGAGKVWALCVQNNINTLLSKAVQLRCAVGEDRGLPEQSGFSARAVPAALLTAWFRCLCGCGI